MDSKLIDSCFSKLDDLEAIIYQLKDENHLRFLRNRLTNLVDDYTLILSDEDYSR